MANIFYYEPKLEDYIEDDEAEARGQLTAYLTVLRIALAIYNEQISKGVPEDVAQLLLPNGFAFSPVESRDFDLITVDADEFIKTVFVD